MVIFTSCGLYNLYLVIILCLNVGSDDLSFACAHVCHFMKSIFLSIVDCSPLYNGLM